MMFESGQVWMWGWGRDNAEIYLLLEMDPDFLQHTVRTDDQESWIALNLETGVVRSIRVHNTVISGAKWNLLS